MFFFHLSSHVINVAIKGGCKVVVHGIQNVLDVHFNWVMLQLDVANAINTISHKAIFQNFKQ
jgi:hypothetical protein